MELEYFRVGEKSFEFQWFSPLVETLSKTLGIHSFFGSREGRGPVREPPRPPRGRKTVENARENKPQRPNCVLTIKLEKIRGNLGKVEKIALKRSFRAPSQNVAVAHGKA